ncbi:MAG: hypothetical protein WA463_09930, partial [Terriglobales bacterium]
MRAQDQVQAVAAKRKILAHFPRGLIVAKLLQIKEFRRRAQQSHRQSQPRDRAEYSLAVTNGCWLVGLCRGLL